jgi:hypothetical protein
MELGLGALGLNSGIYFVALRQDAYSRTLRFVVK